MLRPYTDGDLDHVLDVWFLASLQAHPFLPADFFAGEREQIADEWLPVAETMVYEMDGRVVGFLALIGNDVGGFFVHPEHQGRGIGRRLMDHAKKMRPFLELDVLEANLIGRRFYDLYGFEVVGRHVDETTGEPELRLRLR